LYLKQPSSCNRQGDILNEKKDFNTFHPLSDQKCHDRS
jgi:hypothetical protein